MRRKNLRMVITGLVLILLAVAFFLYMKSIRQELQLKSRLSQGRVQSANFSS